MYKEKMTLSAEIEPMHSAEEGCIVAVTFGNLLKLKKIRVERHGNKGVSLEMPTKDGDDVFCFCDNGMEASVKKAVAEVVNQPLSGKVNRTKGQGISLNPEKIVANIWQKRESDCCDSLLARADAVLDGKIMLLGLEIHCLRGNLFLLHPSMEKELGIEPFVEFFSSDYAEQVEKVVLTAYKSSGMFLGPIQREYVPSTDSVKKALFQWGSMGKKRGAMG
ncbi:MAG: hypothetical protein R3Y63_11995 [Eubacteriales bacterium]